MASPFSRSEKNLIVPGNVFRSFPPFRDEFICSLSFERLVTIACSSVVALLLVEASFPALASSVILLASLVNGLLALFFNVCDNVFLFLQQTFKIIYFTLFSTTPCYFSS
ncbi:hypothetical protein OUZ56_033049 [Daphnia magna]|uniref:Uncharacterized protein n=1 Tax=Daphnia magna TaxID=35525 RepID=A0ABR0BA36_9CRUS|nr:hypothetical protein OUZ56_033049 [Daphnia magna]